MTVLAPHWGPHWVYRMFDADGDLLYVGMTATPRNRLRSWRSEMTRVPGHWFGDAVQVRWAWFDNKADAAREESRAVKEENPAHNIRLRGGDNRGRGRACAAEGCERPVAARGVCWTHYKRASRAGTLDELYPRVAS